MKLMQVVVVMPDDAYAALANQIHDFELPPDAMHELELRGWSVEMLVMGMFLAVLGLRGDDLVREMLDTFEASGNTVTSLLQRFRGFGARDN